MATERIMAFTPIDLLLPWPLSKTAQHFPGLLLCYRCLNHFILQGLECIYVRNQKRISSRPRDPPPPLLPLSRLEDYWSGYNVGCTDVYLEASSVNEDQRATTTFLRNKRFLIRICQCQVGSQNPCIRIRQTLSSLIEFPTPTIDSR